MSPTVLAWIVSLVGAAAFVALGVVLGRRRVPVEGGRVEEEARDRRAVFERAAARAASAPSREEALRELLGALDGSHGTVVLADAHGLPLAAYGEHSADALAALAGTAGNLLARVEEVLPGAVAAGLDVRLGAGRILQVRILDADPHGPVVATLSRTPASEADFESVRKELRQLVAGPQDGALAPEHQGDS